MSTHVPALAWPQQKAAAAALVALAGVIVIAASPWMIVSVAIALVLGAMGWVNAPAGIGIVAATIPVQEAVAFPIGPAEVTATQLTLLPFVAGWLLAWFTGRVAAPVTSPIVAWGLVVLALGVSIGAAVDRMAWGQEVYRWTVALALLVIASSAIKTVRHAWFVLIGVMAGVVGSTLFAAIQVATNDGPPSFQTGTLMRAYGAFGEPNPFAAYLEMSVLLLIPIALVTFRSRAGLAHFVPLIVVAMGVGALALTQSRGGMLGFAAGCAVIAWWYARWSRTLLLVAILFMVPMMLFTAPGRSVTERFTTSMATFRINEQTTPANWSVHERVAHWRAGLNMLEAEPVTGIGAGNFDARYREHTSVWRFRIPRGHAHNGFIQMGAQSGLIGLVAYLALFFVVGARAVRGIHRAQDHSARALALGSLGVLVAVTVHGQFDYLHGLSLNLAFVIALAMTNLSLRDECNALPPSGASS